MGLQYTYESLLAALQSWNEDTNADFVAALPEIMNSGELRLQRDLDIDVLDSVDSTASTASGSNNVTKPANLVAERNVTVTVGGQEAVLEKRSLGFCKMYGRTIPTGIPRYYADLDSATWFVTPQPTAVNTVNVHGIFRPQTLVDVGTTNTTWLSTRYPDLLRMACQVEACRFLKKWNTMASAEAEYQARLLAAKHESQNQRRTDVEDLQAGRQSANQPAQ